MALCVLKRVYFHVRYKQLLPGEDKDWVSFGDDEGFDKPSMATDAPSSLSICVVSDSDGVGPI